MSVATPRFQPFQQPQNNALLDSFGEGMAWSERRRTQAIEEQRAAQRFEREGVAFDMNVIQQEFGLKAAKLNYEQATLNLSEKRGEIDTRILANEDLKMAYDEYASLLPYIDTMPWAEANKSLGAIEARAAKWAGTTQGAAFLRATQTARQGLQARYAQSTQALWADAMNDPTKMIVDADPEKTDDETKQLAAMFEFQRADNANIIDLSRLSPQGNTRLNSLILRLDSALEKGEGDKFLSELSLIDEKVLSVAPERVTQMIAAYSRQKAQQTTDTRRRDLREGMTIEEAQKEAPAVNGLADKDSNLSRVTAVPDGRGSYILKEADENNNRRGGFRQTPGQRPVSTPVMPNNPTPVDLFNRDPLPADQRRG